MSRSHRLTSLLLLLSVLAPAWIAAGELGRSPLEAKLATVGALAADEVVPKRPAESGRSYGGFTLDLGVDGGGPPLRSAAASFDGSRHAARVRPSYLDPADCRPLSERLPYDATAPPVA